MGVEVIKEGVLKSINFVVLVYLVVYGRLSIGEIIFVLNFE